MKSFINRVKIFIQTLDLIQTNETVIVALSGGIDSMVLFYVLLNLQKELSIKLEAAHVNHRVRHPDSDREEEFLSIICSEKKVKLHTIRLSGFDLKSSEEALREARYGFFDSILARNPGAKLATAHHLNDQLETVIMRLMRGTSVKGLRGIPAKRERYIRPLLHIRRSEIEIYARDHHIEYQEDFTNNLLDKTRNRIRRQIIPVLTDIFGDNMYADFQHASEEIHLFYDTLRAANERIFRELIQKKGEFLIIKIEDWRTLNNLQHRHLIEYCVYKLCRLNSSFADNFIGEIARYVNQGRTGSVFPVNKAVRLIKNRQNLVFSNSRIADEIESVLNPGTEIDFGRNKLSLQEVQSSDIRFTKDRRQEYICGDRITFPLMVRAWKRGDFFYPLGMDKKQKLSDFFINQKIERQIKKQIPIVENNGEIVWLAGLRLDNRYRLESDCRYIYKLEWKMT